MIHNILVFSFFLYINIFIFYEYLMKLNIDQLDHESIES